MSDSRVTEPVIAVERNLLGELMTRDKDMLDLMPDAPFRAAHPGLRIIGPVEFLKELKSPLMIRRADEDDEVPEADPESAA